MRLEMTNAVTRQTKVWLMAVLFALSANVTFAAEYAVIVNADNPVTASSGSLKELIGQLYLRKRGSWPKTGIQAKPFARTSDSDEQTAFLSNVLSMSHSNHKGHWVGMKFKGKKLTPPEMFSDKAMIQAVKKHEGAFGVVSKSSLKTNPKGVKTLFTFST